MSAGNLGPVWAVWPHHTQVGSWTCNMHVTQVREAVKCCLMLGKQETWRARWKEVFEALALLDRGGDARVTGGEKALKERIWHFSHTFYVVPLVCSTPLGQPDIPFHTNAFHWSSRSEFWSLDAPACSRLAGLPCDRTAAAAKGLGLRTPQLLAPATLCTRSPVQQLPGQEIWILYL